MAAEKGSGAFCAKHSPGLSDKRRLTPLLPGGCAIAILLIRLYQVTLRPLLIGGCKFCPTCSEYAIEALRRHGLIRGSRLGVRRLLRCHPFSPGGIDPVPPRDASEV